MLKGFQKKYLKGLAHSLKPVVYIGQKGITDSLLKSLNQALDTHELIKARFVDFKEKDLKKELADLIQQDTGCELIGIIGHLAIFFRPNADPEKRKITLPQR